MARPSLTTFVDFSDPAAKRDFLRFAGACEDVYEVALIPRRPTRTLRQNSYWHGCVVEALRQFLAAQDYENCDHEFAHEILKEKFLRVPVLSPRTGRVMGYRTRSTGDLDTAEFTDLIERARAWLADRFNVVVPDPMPEPERSWERKAAARAAGR